MCLVSPIQYSWTLFAGPLSEHHGWPLATVQLGFLAFVAAQTLVQLPVGALADRYGTTPIYPVAALFVVIGWGGIAVSDSLPAFFLLYGIAGLAAGAVYCVSVGMSARIYAGRRGLAVGVTVAGYAAGTAPLFPFIDRLIAGPGYQAGLVVLAGMAAAGLLCIGLLVRLGRRPSGAEGPRPSETDVAKVRRAGPAQLGPGRIVRTGEFWLMYAIFAAIGTGGVALVANFKAFADGYGVGTGLLLASLMLQQGANGVGQVTWGWASDTYGRTRIMTLAFAVNSLALFLLPVLTGSALGLLLVAPLVILTWGQAFALLPALLVDRFGSEHSAGNQGLLYSAKAVSTLLGGAVVAWLATRFGWASAFVFAGVLAALAAAGVRVLKGMTAGASDAPRQRSVEQMAD
jgi:MFS transporter, OFA family, oxalate/formate antiporter